MEIALIGLVIAIIFISRSIKVVPQQHAWVIERLGKYHETLTPGLNILIPFGFFVNFTVVFFSLRDNAVIQYFQLEHERHHAV